MQSTFGWFTSLFHNLRTNNPVQDFLIFHANRFVRMFRNEGIKLDLPCAL